MVESLTPVLGSAGAAGWSSSSFPWWQALGGTLTVFALLFLFLRGLGRWQGRASCPEAALLEVWSLGPRREIQVVRLKEEVHYVYRHESALVLLQKEDYAAFRASRAVTEPGRSGPLAGILGRLGLGSRPALSTAAGAEVGAGDLEPASPA